MSATPDRLAPALDGRTSSSASSARAAWQPPFTAPTAQAIASRPGRDGDSTRVPLVVTPHQASQPVLSPDSRRQVARTGTAASRR
jgi:hypothetical protein